MFVESLLAVVLAFAGSNAIAQTPRHVDLHAGHVLDVKSGKMLADQTLVIEDGKIVSIGRSGRSEGSRGRASGSNSRTRRCCPA